MQATIPAGADASNTDPNGGSNSTGIVDVRNLDLPAFSEVTIQFEVTLQAAAIDGTIVTNQSDLVSNTGVVLAVTDDPNVNGQASPTIDGDEDPTRLLIEGIPPELLTKANTQATATIGETFSYQIAVPSVPHSAPIYDVRILDDLAASAADLVFIDATVVSGPFNGQLQNVGSPTNLIIQGVGSGLDIPAGEQIVVELTVQLTDTPTNVRGLTFTNTAAYTYNLLNNAPADDRPGDPGTIAADDGRGAGEPDARENRAGADPARRARDLLAQRTQHWRLARHTT